MEVDLQELDPRKTYVALVKSADLPTVFRDAQFPKNVVAAFDRELIEFEALSRLVDRLGYKLVEKSDPRFEGQKI